MKTALEDATLTSDPLVAVYSEQLANARILPLVPNWDGETGKALLDALNAIVLTGADPRANAPDAVRRHERHLDQLTPTSRDAGRHTSPTRIPIRGRP